jgi:hypothetical protein
MSFLNFSLHFLFSKLGMYDYSLLVKVPPISYSIFYPIFPSRSAIDFSSDHYMETHLDGAVLFLIHLSLL